MGGKFGQTREGGVEDRDWNNAKRVGPTKALDYEDQKASV